MPSHNHDNASDVEDDTVCDTDTDHSIDYLLLIDSSEEDIMTSQALNLALLSHIHLVHTLRILSISRVRAMMKLMKPMLTMFLCIFRLFLSVCKFTSASSPPQGFIEPCPSKTMSAFTFNFSCKSRPGLIPIPSQQCQHPS